MCFPKATTVTSYIVIIEFNGTNVNDAFGKLTPDKSLHEWMNEWMK